MSTVFHNCELVNLNNIFLQVHVSNWHSNCCPLFLLFLRFYIVGCKWVPEHCYEKDHNIFRSVPISSILLSFAKTNSRFLSCFIYVKKYEVFTIVNSLYKVIVNIESKLIEGSIFILSMLYIPFFLNLVLVHYYMFWT